MSFSLVLFKMDCQDFTKLTNAHLLQYKSLFLFFNTSKEIYVFLSCYKNLILCKDSYDYWWAFISLPNVISVCLLYSLYFHICMAVFILLYLRASLQKDVIILVLRIVRNVTINIHTCAIIMVCIQFRQYLVINKSKTQEHLTNEHWQMYSGCTWNFTERKKSY